MLLAFFGFISIVFLNLHITLLPGEFHSVSVEIPVVFLQEQKQKVKSTEQIHEKTPVVLLSSKAFFFGFLRSFTTQYSQHQNKFFIPHHEGAPQFYRLEKELLAWMKQTKMNSSVVFFSPTDMIPMTIVIQIIAALKKRLFKRVILAQGIF